MLYLRVLGGLSLESSGGPLTGPATQPRRLALLAVLAVAEHATRDRLLALLWPESDTERARGALKQALYGLRRELAAPQLTLGAQELRLNPTVIESDVAAFRRALAAGHLEEAVSLYGGPLLDGVHVRGDAELELWIDEHRSQLCEQYRDALEQLALAAETAGNNGAAVTWWRRCAAADPLSGRIAVALMRAFHRAGDASSALRHASLHAQVVRQELGCAPDPAVTRLASEILAG